MIFKLVKFFIKLGIAIAIIAVLFVVLVVSTLRSTQSYIENGDMGYRNASKIIDVHQQVEWAKVGDTCICAICMKENNSTMGAEFVKKKKGMNSCCPEHEREYQIIYDAWARGASGKHIIESHGAKFK